MHSLTPFGVDLLYENMVEDMTWDFVTGLTVAREILESYGCVVPVILPRRTDAAIGAGGTHVKLWLPSSSAASDPDGPAQEAYLTRETPLLFNSLIGLCTFRFYAKKSEFGSFLALHLEVF